MTRNMSGMWRHAVNVEACLWLVLLLEPGRQRCGLAVSTTAQALGPSRRQL